MKAKTTLTMEIFWYKDMSDGKRLEIIKESLDEIASEVGSACKIGGHKNGILRGDGANPYGGFNIYTTGDSSEYLPRPDKCPNCDGEGSYNSWGTTNWKGEHPNVIECYVCKGTGRISDESWRHHKMTGTWPA